MSEDVVVAAPQVEDPYEFRLTGPGLEIKRHVSETAALQLIAVALGGAGGPVGTSLSRIPTSTPSGTGRLQSAERMFLREFIDEVNARKIPEKILAIAQFLSASGQKQAVTREEIRNSFRHAGDPIPANLPRDFTNTVSLGWIAPDPQNTDEYFVTRKGTQALEGKFSEVDTTPPARRRRRAGTAAGEEPVDDQPEPTKEER